MSRPKYKITINHLEQSAGIHKLERDGFKREDIVREMYRQTDGANTQERTRIMEKLYDRQPGEK